MRMNYFNGRGRPEDLVSQTQAELRSVRGTWIFGKRRPSDDPEAPPPYFLVAAVAFIFLLCLCAGTVALSFLW